MPYDKDPEKRNAYMREYRRHRKDGGSGGLGTVRRRGRKSIDIKLLGVWEFEWYKAFHLLRDGTQLPPDPAFVIVNAREARAHLQWWKRARLKEILGDMRFDSEPGSRIPSRAEMEYAELQRKSEIASLERGLKPKKVFALAERRKIWDMLIQARTSAAVEKACGAWAEVEDVRALGFACFPAHVSANVKQFLAMKQKRNRFPVSDYADDSRLEHLARGMAGVMLGVSPLTAVERLRNMKHAPGGPLWDEAEKRCRCWRHELEASHRYWESLKRIQEGETTP